MLQMLKEWDIDVVWTYYKDRLVRCSKSGDVK